ncbi:MAG: MerR family transcriptional regulator [Rickettsiales bacterium]|jgi:DNA-binding transcriptional MerR regulator|nr:MerR family transcriptional regulator [Rickettsiales bacterium]
MVLIVDRKRSIGDAAREVDVQEHVIRFWETQFSEYVKPEIGAGKRRYFYDRDIKILKTIKYYLYDKGLTIKGLQTMLKNGDVEARDFKNVAKEERAPEIKISATGGIKNIKNDLRQFRVKLNSFYEKLKGT